MYYIIYKVTNLVDDKMYHGKHVTDDLNDDYIGTGGKHYKNAVKKYGKENFKREIRMLCRSYEVMTEMEEYLSHKEEWVNDPNCYNENHGGDGGWYAVNKRQKEDPEMNARMRRNMSLASKGKKKSKAHRAAMSLGQKNSLYIRSGELNGMFSKHHTDETKQLQSISKIGKSFCRWITNGVDNKYILKNLSVPEGYKYGRTLKKNTQGIFIGK